MTSYWITSDNINPEVPGTYIVVYSTTDTSGNSSSIEVEIVVVDPLSIMETNIENVFLFPNPAENMVIINNVYSNANISIYDVLGKQQVLNRINNFENNSILISTSKKLVS